MTVKVIEKIYLVSQIEMENCESDTLNCQAPTLTKTQRPGSQIRPET